MRAWIATLVIALAIPVGAIVLVGAAEAAIESRWLAEIEAEFGPQPPEIDAQVRLAALCSDPAAAAELGPACDDTRFAAAMRLASGVAALIAVALLVAFVPVQAVARRNRVVLARVFRPGLFVVLAGLLVLMILNGALVMGTTWLLESGLLGYVHPFIIATVGVAVLVGSLGVIRATIAMTREKPIDVRGISLDRDTDGRLFELVDDVAASAGTAPPDHIVAGLDPTFFVVEAPVKAFDGQYKGRTLFISTPLCRILNESEARAVIGHELGHFKGEDTAFSRRFYPVYRGAIESLTTLDAASRRWSGLALIPPVRILAVYFEAFANAEREISRDRELAADQVGATASSAMALASALIKLHAHSSAWGDIYTGAVRAVRDGRQLGNFSARYVERAVLGTRASHLANLGEGVIRHPFDSHPPIRLRLERLEVDTDAAVAQAASTQPVDAAIELLGEAEELELDLTERLEEQVISELGIARPEESVDVSASLRTAASSRPAVAAVVALFERLRGPDLGRPFHPDEEWVSLVDLEVLPHATGRAFAPQVPLDQLPSGDQAIVSGVAGPGTPAGTRYPAGTRFKPVGYNFAEERRLGLEEDLYDVGGRIVVVRGVGDWPIDQQLAGLLVVPESDPLNGTDSVLAGELAAVIEGLRADKPSAGDSGSVP